MAGAELVWFQRRFKELLETGRTAVGGEKPKRAVPVQSSHVSMGYPANIGLADGSDLVESHSCSGEWDFVGYHDLLCLQFKVQWKVFKGGLKGR